jgi:hypothetical protein
MEITVDGARVIASVIPVALLIIAVHTRGLRRRIRLVPKRFAFVATIAVILAAIVAVGFCIWCTNSGTPLTGAAAWFVTLATFLLGLQTAGTFVEFVVISMQEEEEPARLAAP